MLLCADQTVWLTFLTMLTRSRVDWSSVWKSCVRQNALGRRL